MKKEIVVIGSGFARLNPVKQVAARRKPLLEAGIRLYESRRLTPGRRESRPDGRWSSGSSDSSLHAKTFLVDESKVFVGSFHFEPRPATLDTEKGFAIESPTLARQIAHAFHRAIPTWSRARPFGSGAVVWIISMLPIDWLL